LPQSHQGTKPQNFSFESLRLCGFVMKNPDFSDTF
jgi:hypothetical protein